MYVHIRNNFHNTVTRVRYNGGVHPIPGSALRRLCPWRDCRCLLSPAGDPEVVFKDEGVLVDYDPGAGWVLVPVESQSRPGASTTRRGPDGRREG